MKRIGLSILSFIFAGIMGLAVFCPLASFQVINSSTKAKVQDIGQKATTLYFVESIFVDDDKLAQSKADKLEKTTKINLSELSASEKEKELLNCAEFNRYDVYNFAKQENLTLTHGVNSNLQNQMKVVSGLTFAFFISAGLVALLSLLEIFFKSHKLRGFGTLFTFVTLLFSIAMVVTTEFVLKTTEATLGIVASVKWTAYLIIAYVAVYMIVRMIINKKLKKL